MTAYEQGYRDAMNGWRRSDNPYPPGTKGRRDWLVGWNAAYAHADHNANL